MIDLEHYLSVLAASGCVSTGVHPHSKPFQGLLLRPQLALILICSLSTKWVMGTAGGQAGAAILSLSWTDHHRMEVDKAEPRAGRGVQL